MARTRAAAFVAFAMLNAGCVRRAETGPEPRTPPAAFEGTFAPPTTRAEVRVEVQEGYATWYGAALAGHKTASGERFDPGKLTAAQVGQGQLTTDRATGIGDTVAERKPHPLPLLHAA